jgi:probable F420-dependent oxidoreductase
MQFTVQYPLPVSGGSPPFAEPDSLRLFAQTAEVAGFSAIAFAEHPAPSRKWLEAGGQETFDPLSALAYCAAMTRRIRLMAYSLILPYRNPLLIAKSIATVDLLSRGRLTLVVGSGYLRSEFSALGIDFDQRNDLFDEAIAVLREVWCTDSFNYTGEHFFAPGQVSLPGPQQEPCPPLWIGGNSRRARHRAAEFGDGWSPVIYSGVGAATARTFAISSIGQLRDAIDEMRAGADAVGRDGSALDVQVLTPDSDALTTGLDGHLERVAELQEAGVTWLVINPAPNGLNAALESLVRYGDEVIKALDCVSK